ncbi:phospholipid phosphatase [Marivirga tractuosa]|uniref:Phosphoesterase PA-phosphatase related protein n=1 Tax=Marivirga tractuosa (strain ATCC 23168 / DSM 4126 / NBRC 15989 / NCIMB 1408 / VKM B-1430 / H-43) TaxID=643867 RepID=E4TQF8_MARTH|nr:phosphatase PAP2 family protein [Marivirga tractuosa]ADR23651.1 phosphoesterase PA-phosphatase related protein [Marivirga tractuosa DSM 4126]BDD15668.1 phospholipid phosphatase [Marivirga tractuosa]
MKYIFILIFSLSIFNLQAQQTADRDSDSLKTKYHLIKSAALPFSLITAGLFTNNSQFEKDLQSSIRAKVGNNFQFKIDDHFQYVPIVEMYLADVLQVEAKNHWFDQTKYLLISNVISTAITQGLKRITLKTRPDLSSEHSFPSGHTTFSFTNASVLMHEFKDSAPVLAYSGYFFSSTTAAFRVINDRHWISDVLVGAGIGILVTELVYYFEPLENFNPFKKNENINFVPMIDQNSKRFYFSYTF